MPDEPTVLVIDDDEHARRSVCALVKSMGLRSASFGSAEEFLEQCPPEGPCCLITDLRMLGMSGLELLEQLRQRSLFMPVILLTAFARTPVTVRAIKAGALTVLDKPYADDDLWEAIRTALAAYPSEQAKRESQRRVRATLEQLSDQERQVLDLVVQGQPNKQIARRLEVSVRTVANRRAELLTKLRVASTAELIQRVVEAREGDR